MIGKSHRMRWPSSVTISRRKYKVGRSKGRPSEFIPDDDGRDAAACLLAGFHDLYEVR